MELVTDNPKPVKVGVKKKKLVGAVKPRIMSIPLKGKSRGEEFAKFAEKCGYPLFPWQKFIANDFLTVDETGAFKRKTVAVILSRQNGKTMLIALRILFGLCVLEEKSVVAMSSKRGMAEDTFRKVCSIIEANEFLRSQVKLNRGEVGYRGNGKEHLDLLNGARYEIVAGTSDGARGKSANLLFVDELRYISEEAWAAAKPITIAMGDKAQTYVCSNAGDAFSHVLNDLRDKALSYPSPTLGWYEYSAPQHAKPTDRSAWAASNPSLGITITESGLEEALSVMPMEKFLPEHMCMWVSSLSSPWPIGSWEACADSNLSLPIGPDTFMAFDVAISKRTATLVAGQYLPNGKIGVGIMDQWRSDTAVDELQIAADIKTKWVDKYFPRMIMFDHYSTASIAARLAASGCRMVDVSGTAFYQASGDLLDAIVNNRIVHMGQESFDLQMNACAAKTNDSGWRIVRRASAGDVSAPISLAMIVHKMQEPVSTPMIVAG
jgi:hypothetical protein